MRDIFGMLEDHALVQRCRAADEPARDHQRKDPDRDLHRGFPGEVTPDRVALAPRPQRGGDPIAKFLVAIGHGGDGDPIVTAQMLPQQPAVSRVRGRRATHRDTARSTSATIGTRG